MSILKKPYEVSVWLDVWDNSTKSFTEEQVAIIGSDTMTSQYRVLEPKLKRNVNGSNEFTFKMHRRYKDSATGEQITNPFIDLIANETKLKLKHDGKWYDFLVKNIQQDSNNATYTYSATDLHITELSKNGYGLVLDTSLMNNMGTVNELADRILEDTGWSLAGTLRLDEVIEEQLVEMTTSSGLSVHVPYSSLKNKPEKFQYFTSLGTQDEYGVYSGEQTSVDVTETNPYTTDERAIKFGFYYPTGWRFIQITPKRAHCKVFTHKSAFNPALNKIVYFYNDGAVAGYSETEYITPNLISNLITNNTFKSTTGWTGSYSGGQANQGADLNAEVKSSTLPRDLLTDMKEGNYDPNLTYTPCLRIKLKDSTSIVVNSGPYDNRTSIKEYSAGQKFVLFYKETTGTDFTAKIGARNYSPESGQYNTVFDKLLMTFSSSEAVNYVTNANTTEFAGYRYIIAEVNDGINLTQKETQKLKAQLFLSGAGGAEYSFSDFQLFPFVPETEGSSVPMLPVNVAAEAKAVTKYYYYNVEDNPATAGAEGYVASAQEYKYLTISDTPVKDYKAVYSSEKIRSIDVKQSNYFNAIQSLCEAFECWSTFVIGHTDAGKITSKSVTLSQYIDEPNHAGFRYGVNLKNSKRTIDSKQVVTKLIVPDSVNEHAPNGFCSIARAGANPSGENYIYNFQYYINMGLLNAETVDEILYNPGGNYGEISGYYTKLLEINQELTRLTDDYTSKSLSLMQAHADLQVAENGRIASEEKYQDAADSFAKITGYDFQELNIVEAATTAERDAEIARRKEQIEKDQNLQGFLTTVAEYYSAWQKYRAEEITAKNLYDTYKTQSDELQQQIKTYNDRKTELNKAFFAVFYRFIQEGTWKGDEHTDHEKYYFDAKTTSDNSCMPKVTYSFSVLDLSGIKDSETWTDVKGYEALNFNLADKTWVEDPEIFGNAREEVVITEITYVLDEPDKNTIKVQNYKDQFADLFQKQTATVQQVQFAKGAWSKSTKFTEDQPAGQAAFLQNALANAELILQNAGEQSVVWDKNGITVTDVDTPSQQLRIVGGAIMMRDEDEDGLGWKVGITSKGINAKLITAGQINTGLIQIMNGEEPYFRWDAYGITAYYFDTANSGKGSYSYGLNTRRGVRFDRLGIYGYRNPADKETGKLIDGATWHPESPEEVQQYAQFALTWDGLYLNLGHATYSDYYYYNESTGLIETGVLASPVWHAGTAQIGKTSKYLFNKWVTDKDSPYHGLPYYDPSATDEKVFAKIFAIGGADGNDELAIYDDGTLVARRIKLTGSIEWTKNSSPSKSVYGKVELTEPPANNTPYVNIPERDGDGTETNPYVWHQIADISDTVYAHTDNGGATWEGPFLITGRSIEYTIVQYCMADRGTDPKLLSDSVWSEFFPVELIDGKCVFTRAADKYNNGQQSEWRYSVGYIGTSNYRIVLDNDYASIPVKNQVNPKKGEENIHDIVDNAWSTSTTARVYYGDEPDTRTWVFSAIDSQASNGLTGVVSYNTITIRPQTAGKLAGEEHVVGIQAYNADSDTTLYTSFTAAKLHAGDDAIGYKVVGYPTALVRHHGTENAFTPEKFKLQALKKIGTSQFEDCVGYWKYSINNNENEIFFNEGAAASEITIQPDKLIDKADKSTLKSLNIFFYLDSTDKVPADKEIITVAEDGKDGVSIKGIDELYYASVSDNIEDVPEVDVFNADGTENLEAQWKRKISETGYSEQIPYLWNAEKMLLSEDGTQNDFSTPALIAAWGAPGAEGRGLDTIISYYFVNQSTIEPPTAQPNISSDDVTVIIVPDGWMTSTTDFQLKAGDCLWEKSFYKYTYALEDGNIYQPAEISIIRAIPKDVYRIALTNDSGVVVTDKNGDGGAFGDNVKTKVIVYKGDEDDTANWTITGTSADLVFTETSGEFQITGFVADQQVDPDNGYLILTATQEGKSNLSTTFKVSKLKQGEPGADAVAYWLTCSSATIVVNDKGEYNTTNITFEGKQQIGTQDATNYTPTKFELYADGVLTETISGVASVTCALGTDKYKVAKNLTCKMYLGEVVIDNQTAEVVRDGASLAKMDVFNYYLATEASSGVTISTEGWTLDLANAQITETKRYLWNYETIISYKEDGSTISATESEPSIIGVYGQTGPTGVSISSIKDYYGVSSAKNALPTEWFNEDENGADAIPSPSADFPYLWAYERFGYSDGTITESKKRIISELSISIENIKDWFMATATEDEKPLAPTDFEEDGTPVGWTTLEACGHGEEKPYLWTVEIIGYNYGKDDQVTEVTLVTRVARSVKEFHEYYCITNNPTRPAPIKLSTDGNLILDKTTDETTKTTTVTTKYDSGDATWTWTLDDKDEVPSIEQGEWLWNQEVVEYTTKDKDGLNKYSTTSVQMMGYIGTSPYLINLSSDFATIPYTYDGQITSSVFKDIDFTFQVFNGAKELERGKDYVVVNSINGVLDEEQVLPQVVVKTKSAYATFDEDFTVNIEEGKDIFTSDWARGEIAVELHIDGVKMASATYELARQAGGVDGSYEYLVTSTPIIKKLTSAEGNISYEPNEITLTLLKRVGDKDPVTSTATRWAKTYIDGELTTEKQSFQGTLTISGEITTEVKVEVFADEACTSIIDREIVPVIADGVDAYNSAVITVYCRAEEEPEKGPGTAEYYFSQKDQSQALVWTGNSNGWSLEPQPDDGKGTTRYKSMVSIRNRELLHKIEENDWSNAIVDELPKTYEEVLTFYTTVTLSQDKTPEEVKPSKPTIPTYNIKDRKFEAELPSGWTQIAPPAQEGVVRYFCTAYVTSTSWTVEVDTELSEVGIYVDEGAKTADVVLYQRPVVENLTSVKPTAPNGTYTYTFSTKNIVGSGETNGWSVTEPEANGYPLWVVKARATGYTDTITVSGWSDPIIEIDTAVNTAEITLYQLADKAPAVPTAELTYTFADKAFNGSLNGWSTSVPARDTDEKKRQACFVTSAIAVSNYPYDIIQTGEWTTPVIDTENAADEYLEVIPKRIVGKYEYNEATEGFELVYYPSIIDVEAYRVVGSADPLKITSTRYFKYFLDEDTKGNKIEAGKNFSISGALNTVTICAYSDEDCVNKTATETVSIVSDSRSIYRILKRWLITNKESGINKTNILATDGGTNEVAGWKKQEDGSPDSVTGAQPYMWAYDRIEYTDGSYQTTDPIRLTSSASYTLSLSNDADIVAISNQTDAPVGELPTVVVSRWVGDLSKDTDSLGVVTCEAPSGWTKDTHYSFGLVDGYYTLVIKAIPTNFFKGNFTFVWKETASATTSLTSKTFSLTAVASLVDYEFKFDQTVFNSSHEGGSYSFKVIKKDNTGTTELLPSSSEIGVYRDGSTTKLTSWTTTYAIDEITKHTYVLKDTTGMVWDTEVVEFVNDGEFEEIFTNESQITATYDASGNLVYTPGAFSIDVYRHVGQEKTLVTRTIRAEIIMADGTSNEQEISSGLVLQGDIKAINLRAYNGSIMTCSKTITVSSKTVTIKEQTRWYHVGESVDGITPDPNLFEDTYEKDSNKWSRTLVEPTESNPTVWYYDKTVFTDNSVQRTAPMANRWSAPYSIMFDNDSASIAANADGEVDSTTLEAVSEVNVTVYHGSEDITSKCNFEWTVSGGTLSSTNTKTTKFTTLLSDTATAIVKVFQGLDLLGSRAFTISKSKQAATYKLSATPNSWNNTNGASTPVSLVVTKYGAGEPQTITSGFTIKVNGVEWTGSSIDSTTTFDLYIGSEKVDDETVTGYKDGNSISTVTNYYAAHTSNTSAPTSWEEAEVVPELTVTNKYLWNYEVITYSQTEQTETDPRVIGVYGDTGRGIAGISERYAGSSSGSAAPPATSTRWKDSISAITLTNTNKYLWCEETITYTAEPTTETIYRLISQRGTDGDTPDMSPTESTITVYGVGTSMSSPPTVPTANATSLGSWTSKPATASSTNKFIFKLEITRNVTYSGDTSTTTYTNPGTPELIAAWCSATVDAAEYAQFLKLTNGAATKGITKDTATGALYFNADFIRSGALVVSDGTNTIFSAGYTGTGSNKAGSVQIGAFTVNQYGLIGIYVDGTNTRYTGICIDSSLTGNIAFFAGGVNTYGTSAPFRVTNAGELTATKATITGDITATAGTIGGFSIGGFNFNGGASRQSMYYGVANKATTIAENEIVICPEGAYLSKFSTGTSEGNRFVMLIGTNFGITQSGKLYTTSAKIGNFELSNGYLDASGGEYGVIRASKPYINNDSKGGSIAGIGAGEIKVGWVVKHSGTTNKYSGSWMSLSENMSTWGGLCGGKIPTMTAESSSIALNNFVSRSISEETISWRFTGNYWKAYDVEGGRSMWLEADWGPDSECSIHMRDGDDGSYAGGQLALAANGTYLNMVGDSDSPDTSEYPLNSILMSCGGSQTVKVYVNGTVVHSSWSKRKTNISALTDQYEQFFDGLLPKKFVYNRYTENSYHMGFIFEEVGESLIRAGLRETDFSGYVLTVPATGEGHLAYSEFIALNTWQIQKLKPRMTAAEQEIASLKLEIQQLRAELEALK